MKTAALVLAAAVGAQAASHAYPATFPFADNSASWPELPAVTASTPSMDDKAHTEDDNGGYVYYYDVEKTITDADFEEIGRFENIEQKGEGFAWCPHGHCEYLLKFTYGAPPVIPWATWNCTAKGTVFGAADFTGIVNGETVCAAGECCKQYIGKPAYAVEWDTQHKTVNELASGGDCVEAMPEELYCSQVIGHGQTNCKELVVSVTERLWMYHCWDMAYYYWISCTTMQIAGLDLGMVIEPAGYLSGLSASQNVALGSILLAPDKVCYPVSYYVPAEEPASEASDASADGSSTAESSSTEEEESSSSAVVVLASIAAAALML